MAAAAGGMLVGAILPACDLALRPAEREAAFERRSALSGFSCVWRARPILLDPGLLTELLRRGSWRLCTCREQAQEPAYR
jgi:hypothetical protein